LGGSHPRSLFTTPPNMQKGDQLYEGWPSLHL
jgi:hypothetical protein